MTSQCFQVPYDPYVDLLQCGMAMGALVVVALILVCSYWGVRAINRRFEDAS